MNPAFNSSIRVSLPPHRTAPHRTAPHRTAPHRTTRWKPKPPSISPLSWEPVSIPHSAEISIRTKVACYVRVRGCVCVCVYGVTLPGGDSRERETALGHRSTGENLTQRQGVLGKDRLYDFCFVRFCRRVGVTNEALFDWIGNVLL